MKYAVLNGSPKGEISVTMQYVHYLAAKNPAYQFEIESVAFNIHKLEISQEAWTALMDKIKLCDGVIWAFPLYFALCCSQYKRFIELIFERGAQSIFRNKPATALTTSIKFYDHTAHNYIRSIAEDLGMLWFNGYSAEMSDLTITRERARFTRFGEEFIRFTGNPPAMTSRQSAIIDGQLPVYRAGLGGVKSFNTNQTVRIITDAQSQDTNLNAMVGQISQTWSFQPEILNLRDLNWKNGCLGCLKCGNQNECSYEGKDDFIQFFREKIMTADILVFAGTVKDRSLSSLWRRFFDRSFFKTHQQKLKGKQLIWLVSGQLSRMSELKELIQGYTENEGANLVAMISDEYDSLHTDTFIEQAANQATAFVRSGYSSPATFHGVSGHKIFRDAIYGHLRMIFMADHRYLKREKKYDFVQKDIKTKIMNFLLTPLLSLPGFWQKFTPFIKTGMIAPYQSILKKAR